MPFKSENIKIAGTKHDGRIKLTPEQKAEIKANPLELSTRKLAANYGVSRRTIQFILDPEKLEENKKRRDERGGWQKYYDNSVHSEAVKQTRRKKQKLFKDGEIQLPTDKNSFPPEK